MLNEHEPKRFGAVRKGESNMKMSAMMMNMMQMYMCRMCMLRRAQFQQLSIRLSPSAA